jgi:hypothetical protein
MKIVFTLKDLVKYIVFTSREFKFLSGLPVIFRANYLQLHPKLFKNL